MVRNQVKISVIVTIHNAEKYLEKCIESVLEQTFTEIEILCVDGGSVDSSSQILHKYAAQDHRIHIVNDSNTSYGHKVNKGISLAQGKYISVLESDDMYLPEMLERLYKAAEEYCVDFVNADYLEFWESEGEQYERLVQMYPEEDYNKRIENRKHPESMRQILRYWTGIFRKDFLIKNNVRMNESPGASFQDMSFRFLTSALAESSFHLNIPVYLYRTDNIFSSVYDPKKAIVIGDEFDFLKKELQRRKIDNPYIWQHFYKWKYNDFYGNLIRFNREERQALLERCYQELDIDKEALKERNIEDISQAAKNFLGKERGDVEEEIETSFQFLEKKRYRQKQTYYILKENRLVIFGCGTIGKIVFNDLYSMRDKICCFTDNNAVLWNTQRYGYSILAPNEVIKTYPDALFIVANKLFSNDIAQQLQAMGIAKEKIFAYVT